MKKIKDENGCVSEHAVDVSGCSGSCDSSSTFDMFAGDTNYNTDCNCCKPAKVKQVSVKFICGK